jgi:hypothetical protein
MPDFEFEQYISVSDFIRECDEDDLEKVVKELEKIGKKMSRGLIRAITETDNRGIAEIEYDNAIDKLTGLWNRLSKEDEEAILAIANKF